MRCRLAYALDRPYLPGMIPMGATSLPPALLPCNAPGIAQIVYIDETGSVGTGGKPMPEQPPQLVWRGGSQTSGIEWRSWCGGCSHLSCVQEGSSHPDTGKPTGIALPGSPRTAHLHAMMCEASRVTGGRVVPGRRRSGGRSRYGDG